MSFLGPIPFAVFAWVAGGAATLAITAYILKLRRRRFEVPFSALWRRVIDQKDANSLWQHLRRVVSLLIALLVIALLLFAALDPTLGASNHDARSVVVLLDASASMKATDGADPKDTNTSVTRLQAAKDKAKALLDGMGGGDVAMIMKVDGQATPLSRFSSDVPMLRKVVDGVTASDTPADLTRALAAAADALRDRKHPLIVIVSDGAFPEAQLGLASWSTIVPAAAAHGADSWATKNLAAVDLSGMDVRYLPVGHRADNVGIIAFNVRRYVANKAAYEVYIEIQNFGPTPAKRKLTLYNGATAVDVRDLQLGPGERQRQIYKELPGGDDNRLRASLRPVEGVGGSDPFSLDDEAFALLPARKKQKVLMIIAPPPCAAEPCADSGDEAGNLYLEGAILVYDNIEPFKITPADYEKNPAQIAGFDAVIFDDYTPVAPPTAALNVMYFHPSGAGSPFPIHGKLTKPRITEVAEDHPVMKWVSLSDVNFDEADVYEVDRTRNQQALAISVRDPVIAAKRDGNHKTLAFGFSLPGPGRDTATDLPLRVAFPLLLVNALDWFAGDAGDLITTYVTGQRERVPVDGVVGATEASITAPDGSLSKAPIADGVATFYPSQVGFYDLSVFDAATPPNAVASLGLAANLANPIESDITPSATLTLGGKALQAPEAFAVSHSQRLWIYFLLLAAFIVVIEWITYHRRITV